MGDVITLSSDEESGTPAKRRKIDSGVKNWDKNNKSTVETVDHLEEITVIKRTSNATATDPNGTETIIVDHSETTSTRNGEKNHKLSETTVADTVIEILDIQDSPVKNSNTGKNTVDRGDSNTEQDKDSEIRDYFNLSPQPTEEPNKNDGVIELKDSWDDSMISTNNHDNDDDNQPSTSAQPNQSILDSFLEICTNAIRKTAYDARLLARYDRLRNMYSKCDNIDNDEEFLKIVENSKSNAMKSPADAVLAFRDVYGYIHDYVKSVVIEIPTEHVDKVKKLEKSMKSLLHRLKYLENQEIDMSKDDEDSNYVKIERYTVRLDKVYKKYCQLLNTDPYDGRLLYQKINLTASKYDEINKAIIKSYKRNKFPSYYDVQIVVRKCIDKYNLALTENEMIEESKRCFKKLGEILQTRRKQELHDNLSVFMGDHDPATDDSELDNRLKQNSEDGERKIQDVIEKYVRLQENNTEAEEESGGSGTSSNSEDDEDEEKDDDGNGGDDNNGARSDVDDENEEN